MSSLKAKFKAFQSKHGSKNNVESSGKTQPVVVNKGSAPEKTTQTERVDFKPICELWNEAYEDLQEQDDELIKKYEAVILHAASENNGTAEHYNDLEGIHQKKINVADQMKDVLQNKMGEVKRNAWKMNFGSGKDVALNDLTEPVLAVLGWANDYIGNALSTNPYASIAWTGVSLLLPMVLNPNKQSVSLAEGLQYVSHLIDMSLIREDLYQRRYTPATIDPGYTSTQAHIGYRKSLEELYVLILKFQAKSVCYYSKNTASRLASDVVKWYDWDSLLQNIKDQEERFGVASVEFKDAKYEEECLALVRRHKESMKRLKSIVIDVAGLRHAVEKAQRDNQRNALLKWLSSVDPSENFRNARDRHQGGTGEWLITSKQFRKWKVEPNSFLWLHGKAGSGKSVLSSTVIKHLEDYYGGNSWNALGFYYFSFSDDKKQDISGMLSSLIRQLCARRPDTPESVQNLVQLKDKGQRPDLEQLQKSLAETIKGFTNVFIVIDALDECPNHAHAREDLLESLSSLQSGALENLHFLCTSRRESDIEAAFTHLWALPTSANLDLSHHKAVVDTDIGLYIDQELSKSRYRSWPPRIKDKVRLVLTEKADGMFQYVVCQFEALQKFKSPFEIQNALENLPKGLDETYNRMLTSIDPEFQERVCSLLKWLAFSNRPLIIEEIAEAFVLDYTLPTPFDEARRLFNPKDVLEYLSGLATTTQTVTIDCPGSTWNQNKSLEIRFAHFSIQEYLISTRIREGPAANFSISKDDAQIFLAESCLAYHLQISQNEIASKEIAKKCALWEYAALNWGSHMEDVEEGLWTKSMMDKALQVFTADTWCLLNMIRFEDPDEGRYPLSSWDKELDELAQPLYYAAGMNLPRITTLLISHGEDMDCSSDSSFYGTALQTAIFHNRKTVVETLLLKGADVNAEGGEYGNALQTAALRRYIEYIKLLLENGADVNFQGGVYGNALQAAAVAGEIPCLKLLLENEAGVNAQGGKYNSALQASAKTGAVDCLQLLVEYGANVNAQGGLYGSALSAAICEDWYDAAQFLISNGAKIIMTESGKEEVRQNLTRELGEYEAQRGIDRLERCLQNQDQFMDEFKEERRRYMENVEKIE